ncbi:hypothetical protein BD626DRAFT_459011 [Schizophyllum amplum]|uniref:Uncharacterized protein n=1 Tax=Schizophyllum amplum TaxID=97359 RepID=A0A550CB43_9AGAR|nr:hypothetical protein BD626DRAFT_459011 [Auriculariopsis ampla]
MAGRPDAIHDDLPPDHVPPINHLPVELLVEIFFHTLPSPDTTLAFPARMFVPPPIFLPSPMVLTAVCAHWRVVAISTPMLWNRIIAGRLDAPCQLRWAALHVARSKDLPLVIRVRASSMEAFTDTREAALFDGMLRVLMPHTRRWREVVLDISNLSTWMQTLHPLPGSAEYPAPAAPQLESAALLRHQGQQQSTCRAFWNWAMSSPALRCVTLDSEYDFLLRPNEIPAVWDHIRTVNLWHRKIGVLEVLDLLQAHPCIEVLHVDCLARTSALVHGMDAATLPRRRAFAPCLHTLAVVNNMRMGVQFFRLLDAPQLRHLAVYDFSTTPYATSASRSRIWTAVKDMLASSPARLTSFYCRNSWQDVFMDIIRLDALQDVKELSFVQATFDDKLAEMLVFDDKTRFLPQLEALALGECRCRSRGKLDDMVVSRAGTLKVLDIDQPAPFYDRAVLEAAKARGLKLKLCLEEN